MAESAHQADVDGPFCPRRMIGKGGAGRAGGSERFLAQKVHRGGGPKAGGREIQKSAAGKVHQSIQISSLLLKRVRARAGNP